MFRLRTGGVLAVVALLAEATLAGIPTMELASASTDRVSGSVKFEIVSTNAQGTNDTVAATGAIHAQGSDKEGERKDVFKFPDGNLVIQHKTTEGSTHESFDPVTCQFKFTEKGTWKVGKNSTGAYTAAKGSGTYRATGTGFGCDENTEPSPFYVHVKAKGKICY